MLGNQTGQTGDLADPLKTELFDFIAKHGGGREAAVPSRLLPLLQGMVPIVVPGSNVL